MTFTSSALIRPHQLYLDLEPVFILFHPEPTTSPLSLYHLHPDLIPIVQALGLPFIIESNFLILPDVDHEQYFYEVLSCSHPQINDRLCDNPSLLSHFEVLVMQIVEAADSHLRATCQSYGILEPERYLFDHWHSNTVAVFEREPSASPP